MRAAVLADSPLKRHFYRTLLASFGWQVDVHDLLLLHGNIFQSTSVDLWLVDANDSDELPDELFDLEHVLFCDEKVPRPESVESIRLTRRLKQRLISMGFQTEKVSNAALAGISLPTSMQAKASDDIELVVAIAASAGGPKAVAEFFATLPDKLPVAFLYAQHIDPSCWQSLATSVNGTRLAASLITDVTLLQANHVHVVPVEGMLMFENSDQVKPVQVPWSGPYAPNFNQFLQMLAQQFGSQTIAIVLSGMDNDGVDGGKFIQQVGGKVWAQSSESAEQPSMPDAVSDTGVVDFRGTPTELANHLIQLLISRRGRS